LIYLKIFTQLLPILGTVLGVVLGFLSNTLFYRYQVQKKYEQDLIKLVYSIFSDIRGQYVSLSDSLAMKDGQEYDYFYCRVSLDWLRMEFLSKFAKTNRVRKKLIAQFLDGIYDTLNGESYETKKAFNDIEQVYKSFQ
jgi:hypothetical protein